MFTVNFLAQGDRTCHWRANVVGNTGKGKVLVIIEMLSRSRETIGFMKVSGKLQPT